jgi:ribosomal-protein-alanine N-acetyltransferase
VEVGYSIDPQFRRQGYARAALRALIERARQEPQVTTFRATVSPDNTPSRDLVLSEGLVEVGEQMDDEDGLEIIYELGVISS